MHILAVLALAQMPWSTTLPARGVAFNFLRPMITGTGVINGAAYLTGRFPTGSGYSLRLEVPFAHLDQSGITSSAFGNPYFGLETSRDKWTFDLGFRPALTPEDQLAPVVGLYSDITQIQTWLPHVATLSTSFTYKNETSTGPIIEVGFAPAGWIPTAGGDVEVVLTHWGSLGFRGTKVWGSLGLGGVLGITQDGDFGARTFYQFGGSLGLTQGQVRPALHFIFPLDDAITNNVDVILGLGVGITTK